MVVIVWNWELQLQLQSVPITTKSHSCGAAVDTISCEKFVSGLRKSRWFSPGTSVSSSNKTGRHDIAEILLKEALNTITLIIILYRKAQI